MDPLAVVREMSGRKSPRAKATKTKSGRKKKAKHTEENTEKVDDSPDWEDYWQETVEKESEGGAQRKSVVIEKKNLTDADLALINASAAKYKEEGNAAWKEQRVDDAIALYTQAIKSGPSDDIHVLYSNRAAAYLALENYSDALADAELALSASNGWWKAFLRKGTALLGLERAEEAVQCFEAGIKECSEENGTKMLGQGLAEAKRQVRMNPNPKSMLKPTSFGASGASGSNSVEATDNRFAHLLKSNDSKDKSRSDERTDDADSGMTELQKRMAARRKAADASTVTQPASQPRERSKKPDFQPQTHQPHHQNNRQNSQIPKNHTSLPKSQPTPTPLSLLRAVSTESPGDRILREAAEERVRKQRESELKRERRREKKEKRELEKVGGEKGGKMGQEMGLPKGWKEAKTEDGQVYWYNKAKKVSTWERPTEDVESSESDESATVETAEVEVTKKEEAQDGEKKQHHKKTKKKKKKE